MPRFTDADWKKVALHLSGVMRTEPLWDTIALVTGTPGAFPQTRNVWISAPTNFDTTERSRPVGPLAGM